MKRVDLSAVRRRNKGALIVQHCEAGTPHVRKKKRMEKRKKEGEQKGKK